MSIEMPDDQKPIAPVEPKPKRKYTRKVIAAATAETVSTEAVVAPEEIDETSLFIDDDEDDGDDNRIDAALQKYAKRAVGYTPYSYRLMPNSKPTSTLNDRLLDLFPVTAAVFGIISIIEFILIITHGGLH